MADSMVRGLACDLEAEPVGGVLLGLGSGFVLGFDDHRGAAGRCYQYVGVAAEVGREGLGVLGEDLAAGHHTAEEVAEGVVGVGFGLLGHVRHLHLGGRDARVPGWSLWWMGRLRFGLGWRGGG